MDILAKAMVSALIADQSLRSSHRFGLIDAIDRSLHLLRLHQPYHESDHMRNPANQVLRGGTRLEDVEFDRNGEV